MNGYSNTSAEELLTGLNQWGSFIGTALLILAGIIIFLSGKWLVSLLWRSFR